MKILFKNNLGIAHLAVLLVISVIAIGFVGYTSWNAWQANKKQFEAMSLPGPAAKKDVTDTHLLIEQWGVKIPLSLFDGKVTYVIDQHDNIVIYNPAVKDETAKLSGSRPELYNECAFEWAATSFGRAKKDEASQLLGVQKELGGYVYGNYPPQYACGTEDKVVSDLINSYIYSTGSLRQKIIKSIELAE